MRLCELRELLADFLSCSLSSSRWRRCYSCKCVGVSNLHETIQRSSSGDEARIYRVCVCVCVLTGWWPETAAASLDSYKEPDSRAIPSNNLMLVKKMCTVWCLWTKEIFFQVNEVAVRHTDCKTLRSFVLNRPAQHTPAGKTSIDQHQKSRVVFSSRDVNNANMAATSAREKVRITMKRVIMSPVVTCKGSFIS